MDELDANLLEAWHEVRSRLANDPAARGRRYERGLRQALRRPVRAWCVSVKASDTRIEPSAMLDGDAAAACGRRERHGVVLFGSLVQHLVRPVVIDLPGLPYDEAARALGIDVRTMFDWMDKGWVSSRKQRVSGRRGKAGRVVWTGSGGVDVCFPQGREGGAVPGGWGSLWRELWRQVPEEFEQTVERVPRMRPRKAEARTPPPEVELGLWGEHFRGRGDFRGFRGWDWVCPGRELADGTWAGCGRVCKKLVAPLPVWTIERMLPPPETPPETPPGGGGGTRAEARTPRRLDTVGVAEYEPRRSRFACAKCWNVQHTASDPDAAWNQLVTAISGGLLYGREVRRPTGIT
ncbi:MAG: hypothetical protein AAF911_03340 [Planctomycetota bacterium]